MNTIAKRFFSALGLAVAVGLAVPRVAHGEDNPYAPQSQASLKQMLSIDWKKGPNLPQGFQDSARGILHGTLVTAGGFCGGLVGNPPGKEDKYPRGHLKKTWALNLQSPQNGWQSLPDFPGVARQGLFSIVVDNQLYAWGGYNYSPPYAYRDGYRLSKAPQGQWSWNANSPLPAFPWRVADSGISAIGSKIYVVGGADYDCSVKYYYYTDTDRDGNVPRLGSRLLVLDTNNLGAGWKELSQCPGTPRMVSAMATVGEKIYVIGGATGDNNPTGKYCTVVDNWQYDPAADAWQRLRDLPVASGNFPSGPIVAFDRYILLVGGYQYDDVVNPDGSIRPTYGTVSRAYPKDAYCSDIWVYDTVTAKFGTVTGLPVNNNLPTTVVQGNQIHLMGGEMGGTKPNFETVEGEPFSKHPELYLVGTIRELEAQQSFPSEKNVSLLPVQRTNPAAKHPLTGEAGGITGVTKGKADLIVPPDTPPGEVWRYGLGFPFQVGPRTAGLFCNIRKIGTGNIDFEIGTDVVLFDDLSKIGDAKPIPISRYEKGVHPDFGKTITAKGPVIGGFVPFGAKLADGSPHPNAGTGFGLNWAIVHAVDERGGFDYRKGKKFWFELFQLAYDGKDLRILDKEYVERNDLLPNSDWMLVNCSLTNAIPDGQDLLYAMPAVKKSDDRAAAGVTVSGVTRWRHGTKGWRPISFTPVTGKDVAWSEPSLIRDVDGGLLMSARSSCGPGSKIAFDLAVWRSTDNGKSWKQVVYRRRCRSRSPVTINQAADGTPFVVANLPPLMRRRDIMCYWPLNDSRTDLGELRIVRDLRGEFGRAPSGSWWRADHPTSAIVRLADGAWHGILVYRIVDNGEIEGSAKPAPQTGCYVEEVHSRGPATEAWRF